MTQSSSITNTLFSIMGILFTFLFPHLGVIPIPFAYVIPVLLVIWFLLKRTNENFPVIGFSFKKFEKRAIWIGGISAIILFIFLNYGLYPLLSKIIFLPKANLDDFKNIRHNTTMYIFILVMGWIVGGFYEELVFHGYIFSRIEKIISGRYAVIVSFIVTNLIFAFYHMQLGFSGMLNAFLAGCAYNFLMLAYKRNLWYSLICHSVFDTIGLTFIYLGYW